MIAFQSLALALISSLVISDFGDVCQANETETCAGEPKAIFYENEDKSGNIVNYFEETEDYQHVQSIINKRGLKGIPLLCATGVFVLFNQEEFDSDSDDEIRILAGTDTCLQPGSVKSIVYAQKCCNYTTADGITVFNGERFNTVDIPLRITEDTQADDAALLQFGKIRSFMIMGKSPWTVTTRYRTFCFRPEGTGEYPICPVASASCFVLPEEQDWLSVRHGCEIQTELEDVPLSYCFESGSGNLEAISDGSDNTTEELEGRAFGQGPFAFCGGNLDEFAMLLRFRLTNDFDSAYQIQFPRNKANSWRTEILDDTMEIVDLCTVDSLIDKQILRVVREMYVYFAEKLLWSKGEGWPAKPWQRVLLVAHETKRCLTEIANKDWLKVAIKLSEDIVKKMDQNGIKESDIDQEFKPVVNYDIAMEFVWLSINYVGAACHAALQYETDFWLDYINVAYDMYLQPMIKHWGSPRDVLDYYPILLGGFETKLQHRSMAAVTTALYKAVSLPKLERPRDIFG